MNNITKYVIPAASSVLGGVVTFFGLQLEQDKITADYAERIKATEIRLEQAQATNARMSDILTKTAADLTEVRKAAQNAASPGLEALGSVDTITRRLESLERQLQEGGGTPSGEVQFTVIDREISELKQQLKRLGSRIAGQSAPVPTVEEIAAELARNYAETLRGPQGPVGPRGDRGQKGDPGAQGPSGAKGEPGQVTASTAPNQSPSQGRVIQDDGLIKSGTCVDIADAPFPGLTFENGAMICENKRTLITMSNRSSLPGKLDVYVIGGRNYILGPGESLKLKDGGPVFFLNHTNPEEGTFVGGLN